MFQHFSSDGVMEYVDMQMYGHQETGSFVVFDLFFSWSANYQALNGIYTTFKSPNIVKQNYRLVDLLLTS